MRTVTYYDPAEHLDEDDRHDWEMQQWLRVQRRLRDIDERGWTRTPLFDEATSTRCCRPGCHDSDVRLIRLTGDVVCATHDPLATPHWGASCCRRED